MVNMLVSNVIHFRRVALWTLLSAVAGAGVGMALATHVGGNQLILPPPVSDEASLPTPVASPGDGVTRSAGGFGVTLYGIETGASEAIVTYRVSLESQDGFTDMLGVPRIVNPDGSVVIPSVYGEAEQVDPEADGLQNGAQSAAVFQTGEVQPGALVRFGPFFEGLAEGASFSATGAELRSGFEVVIHGETFLVTLEDVGEVPPVEGFGTIDGYITTLKFANIEEPGSLMFRHPRSTVTVTVGGEVLEEVKGSSGFTKTEGMDVNAGTASTTFVGIIADDAVVDVRVDSIGRVVKGEWDFPLK